VVLIRIQLPKIILIHADRIRIRTRIRNRNYWYRIFVQDTVKRGGLQVAVPWMVLDELDHLKTKR
jgi:hypothetical protein